MRTQNILGRGLQDVAPPQKFLQLASLLKPTHPAPISVEALSPPIHPQVFCIASGKGGTGKTVFTVNLAIHLVQEGKKVLFFDADLGLGNAHLLLGLNPIFHVGHFLRGEKKIEEVVEKGFPGILFLPGGSGISELANLTFEQWSRLMQGLRELSQEVDMVLLDLPAGIAPQVLRFLKLASDVIVVATPEIPSMVDAYALVKTMRSQKIQLNLHMVINRVGDKTDVEKLFQKISQMMNFHLKENKIHWLGFLPEDKTVSLSIAEQLPVVLLYPDSFVAKKIKRVANHLISKKNNKEATCLQSPSPIKREDPVKPLPPLT